MQIILSYHIIFLFSRLWKMCTTSCVFTAGNLPLLSQDLTAQNTSSEKYIYPSLTQQNSI